MFCQFWSLLWSGTEWRTLGLCIITSHLHVWLGAVCLEYILCIWVSCLHKWKSKRLPVLSSVRGIKQDEVSKLLHKLLNETRFFIHMKTLGHLLPHISLHVDWILLASTYIQELKSRTNPTVALLNLAVLKISTRQGGVARRMWMWILSFLPFSHDPSRTPWWTLTR